MAALNDNQRRKEMMDKTKPPSWMPPEVEMLTQPLTTEEGFLNEACMRELSAAINNTPESFDRLIGNPEWSNAAWTGVGEISGQLAHWAVVQAVGLPPSLAEIVGYVHCALKQDSRFTSWGDIGMFSELSLCDINRLLWDILGDLQQFLDWNEESIMTPLSLQWIDLSALLHNVCISLRNERRHGAAFNANFEKQYRK